MVLSHARKNHVCGSVKCACLCERVLCGVHINSPEWVAALRLLKRSLHRLDCCCCCCCCCCCFCGRSTRWKCMPTNITMQRQSLRQILHGPLPVHHHHTCQPRGCREKSFQSSKCEQRTKGLRAEASAEHTSPFCVRTERNTSGSESTST